MGGCGGRHSRLDCAGLVRSVCGSMGGDLCLGPGRSGGREKYAFESIPACACECVSVCCVCAVCWVCGCGASHVDLWRGPCLVEQTAPPAPLSRSWLARWALPPPLLVRVRALPSPGTASLTVWTWKRRWPTSSSVRVCARAACRAAPGPCHGGTHTHPTHTPLSAAAYSLKPRPSALAIARASCTLVVNVLAGMLACGLQRPCSRTRSGMCACTL
jgi:hypothetical protein